MKISSVLGVILSSDHTQVLLTKRADVPVWVLPGGGIEAGETEHEAMIREITEEVGTKPTHVQHVATYHTQGPFLKPTALFICTLHESPQLLSDEVTDIQYFDVTDLPPLPPFFDQFIHDALNTTGKIQVKTLIMTPGKVFTTFLKYPALVTQFFWVQLKKALAHREH